MMKFDDHSTILKSERADHDLPLSTMITAWTMTRTNRSAQQPLAIPLLATEPQARRWARADSILSPCLHLAD
jgi:hypothetical protein